MNYLPKSVSKTSTRSRVPSSSAACTTTVSQSTSPQDAWKGLCLAPYPLAFCLSLALPQSHGSLPFLGPTRPASGRTPTWMTSPEALQMPLVSHPPILHTSDSNYRIYRCRRPLGQKTLSSPSVSLGIYPQHSQLYLMVTQ